MIQKIKNCFLIAFLAFTYSISAQEVAKTDEKKIQEVINLEADPPAVEPLPDGSIPENNTPPKPLPQADVLKRAINFVKLENPKYTKTNRVNSGTKAECIISFPYKPKELNPQADVEGSFTMHVSIDAKEGKYRYTISKLMHVAKNPDFSGGDVYSEVPKCGSMKLPSEMWKRMRGESLKYLTIVSNDIKEFMIKSATEASNADEW